MPTCAACLRPISSGSRWATRDTEVFHAECLSDAYRSKLKLSEERVRELERQLTETRRAAARVETEVNRFRNEATSAQATTFVLRGRLDQAEDGLALAEERLSARLAELQGARNQVIALQGELAKVKPQEIPEEKNDEDDSALRFKMLELD